MTSIKLTAKRKLIYDVLESSNMPLTAFEIEKVLQKQGHYVWLSTIYRALDYFLENEMIRKADMPINGESHYILKDESHKHFAICLSCKNIIPIEDCPLDSYHPKLKDSNFNIVDHRFMVYGYCSNCQKK